MRLLGTYARLQTVIDDLLVKSFLEKRQPEAPKVLRELRNKAHIADRDRPKIVKAIAVDLSSDAELADFTHIYGQVKDLRDRIAHSSVLETDEDTLVLGSFVVRHPAEETDSREVGRAELDTAIAHCEWLVAQVTYVLATSSLVLQTSLGVHPIRFLKPSRLPWDWDGIPFVHET